MRFAIAGLLVSALTGCAGTPVTSAPGSGPLPFDVCVLYGPYNPSSAAYVQGVHTTLLQANGADFDSVTAIASKDESSGCDVVAKIWQPTTWSVGVDLFAGAEEAPSLSLKTGGYGAGPHFVAALKKELAAGGALHDKAVAAHDARPDAEPEPAPAAAAEPSSALPATIAPAFSAAPRPSDFAVVIGIESYSEITTKAPYAERDADAVKAHLRALGVPERNIVLLKGSRAVKSAIEKYVETWLPKLAKTDSRVYFYFSGHGAPDVKTGKAYLVPWDGDPNFLGNTAVPLDHLYSKLAALPARQVLVALDSCFSGSGGRSVLASGARPLVTKLDAGDAPAKLTILSASAASEISGSLDDKGHGAFTYFLLQGLDAGKTTPKALAEYLTPLVQDEARRLNRDQTPQLQGDGSWPLR